MKISSHCISFAYYHFPKIFPTLPKSQSKPEGPAPNRPSKASISIFDDEEEEVSASRSSSKNTQEIRKSRILLFLMISCLHFQDLFSSVPKSQSVQVKTTAPPPKKTLSSSLFSDDEVRRKSKLPIKLEWNSLCTDIKDIVFG